jgi:MerR family transcriptional regulator, heat shock protein HspR
MWRDAYRGERSMSRTAVSPSTGHMINLDKPLYTISVAAEILATHARTLMMYEHLGLVIPSRTATNRRLYSQRDIVTLSAIQRLTRGHGLNLVGARYLILCLQLLDANGIARPPELAAIDIEHVKI